MPDQLKRLERQLIDAYDLAITHLDLADGWANKDNVPSLEVRDHMIDYHLRVAQIHAQLAVAQKLDTFIGLVFDEGRAITTRPPEWDQ